MRGEEDKESLQGSISTKLCLIGIYSSLVAMNVLVLIVAIVSSSGSKIGFTLFSLVNDGIMLTAVIKEWRVVLYIGRIVLIILMVFFAIVTVAGFIIISQVVDFWPGEFTEKQRNELIVEEVLLSVSLICNGFLFVLLGRYTTKIVSASLA